MAESKPSVSHAKLRYVRIAPRKIRLVADLVRGKSVDEALRMLTYTRKSSAPVVGKLIRSALASAEQNAPTVDVDTLFVQNIHVDGGPALRRFTPRAQGRATRVMKHTSHITVELGSRS
jgi:large subunit ribosomal protein L22